MQTDTREQADSRSPCGGSRRRRSRNRHFCDGASTLTRPQPDLTVLKLDISLHDGEPQTRPALLRGVERFEYAIDLTGRNAWAAVGDRDPERLRLRRHR